MVAAPGGRVGLDILSLLQFDVKVKRLELDGLVLKLRVRPDGAVTVAAGPSTEAATIEVAPPAAARAPDAAPPSADPAALAVSVIDTMAGSSQALDHVSLANGHLEVENEALGTKTVYEAFTVAFDKSKDVRNLFSLGARTLRPSQRHRARRMAARNARFRSTRTTSASTICCCWIRANPRSTPTCRFRSSSTLS